MENNNKDISTKELIDLGLSQYELNNLLFDLKLDEKGYTYKIKNKRYYKIQAILEIIKYINNQKKEEKIKLMNQKKLMRENYEKVIDEFEDYYTSKTFILKNENEKLKEENEKLIYKNNNIYTENLNLKLKNLEVTRKNSDPIYNRKIEEKKQLGELKMQLWREKEEKTWKENLIKSVQSEKYNPNETSNKRTPLDNKLFIPMLRYKLPDKLYDELEKIKKLVNEGASFDEIISEVDKKIIVKEDIDRILKNKNIEIIKDKKIVDWKKQLFNSNVY